MVKLEINNNKTLECIKIQYKEIKLLTFEIIDNVKEDQLSFLRK